VGKKSSGVKQIIGFAGAIFGTSFTILYFRFTKELLHLALSQKSLVTIKKASR